MASDAQRARLRTSVRSALGAMLPVMALLPLLLLAAPEWAGPNIWPDPQLEEVGDGGLPLGWEIHQKDLGLFAVEHADEGVAGPGCLLVRRRDPAAEMPNNAHRQVVSPLIAAEPGWYLLSFWVSYEYTAEIEPHRIAYVEVFAGTTEQPQRMHQYYGYFYGDPLPPSGGWTWRAFVVRVRPGEIGFRLRFSARHAGLAMRLDSFQARKVHVPDTEGHFDSRFYNKHGRDTTIVPDPEASLGHAWRFVEGEHAAGRKLGISHTSTISTPGLYLAEWRIRTLAPGGSLRFHVSSDRIGTYEEVTANDIPPTDDYQIVPVLLCAPTGHRLGCEVHWDGNGGYQLDNVTFRRLLDIDAAEGRALFYDGIDLDRALGERQALTVPGDAWLARGHYTEQMGIFRALDAAGLTTVVSHLGQVRGGGLRLDPPMPDLSDKRLAVLANVPMRALSPQEQYALRRFVADGGGLIVFGGTFGFGYGGLRPSFLAEVLPVTTPRTFDLVQLPDVPLGDGLGTCVWVHEVTARPRTRVDLAAGERPVAVTGRYEHGRVLAVPGTVLGTPSRPWWQTARWQQYLRRAITWLSSEAKP